LQANRLNGIFYDIKTQTKFFIQARSISLIFIYVYTPSFLVV
jgi:hypothetical protein